MVRSIHKTKVAVFAFAVAGTLAISTNIKTPITKADENVPFNVTLAEALTVSVTEPETWASGDTDDLLRNKITVKALTNNKNGVTVSMYAQDTDLRHKTQYSSSDNSSYINPLNANTYTKSTFPANAWGYSLQDTVAGLDSASYLPVVDDENPVTVLTSTIGVEGTKDVFFGARSSSSKKSGTYAQTVYFAAVTDTIDTSGDPPVNPVIPSNPSTDNSTSDVAVYTPSTNRTTYTTRTTATGSGTGSNIAVSGNTKTTTTQVSSGNTTSSYTAPHGVTTSNSGNSSIAGALAVAAAVAATSGTLFFILAKRRDDDDDEENQA